MERKIDILMATYNGEKYVSEQIKSILQQTYKNWTLIIRDDNSDDNTLKILYKYQKKDKRIKIINDSMGNLGFVKNFEELLKYSDSDFIMFSDQDDIWYNNKVEKMYDRIVTENNNIPILVHCNANVCDSNLKLIKKNFIKSIEMKKNNYFFSFIVQGSSIILNKNLKIIALPFLKESYLHDRYLHLLSELFGKKIFIDEPLMNYRQHENNQIGSKSNIINKILKKKYFDLRDRELLSALYNKNYNKLNKELRKLIEVYLEITNININRFKRLYLVNKYGIYMNIKKKIFLILKG